MVTTCGAAHVLAKIGNAQAAFTLRVPALFMDDFRVDEYEFGLRILLEGYVDDGDTARNSDLRGRQAHAAGSVHRLEHVIDQLFQFFVEDQ